MRVLVWHDHGGWMDAFIRGNHDYVVPTAEPDRSRGPAGHSWPTNVSLISPIDVEAVDADVVVAQRLEELDAAATVRARGIPTIFVEHNAPRVDVPSSLHPLRDRTDITIAHVTHWNALMWECGTTATRVVEHGISDPGARYGGFRNRFGVVINEPVRRARVTGSDLIPAFASVAPIDHFGMQGSGLPGMTGLDAERLALLGDLATDRLHRTLAERRAYLHLNRWTSLGLSLLEAMHLAMPVIVLAATEAPRAVPPEAGAISTDLDDLVRAARRLIEDPAEAAARGRVAREAALARYSLARFLKDWDELLDDTTVGLARRRPAERSAA